MTEAELLGQVVKLAERYRVYLAHWPDSRRMIGVPGYPDVTLAGTSGFMLAELKDQDGEVSPAQRRWKWQLQRCGIRWELWRPADLESGHIEETIKALA